MVFHDLTKQGSSAKICGSKKTSFLIVCRQNSAEAKIAMKIHKDDTVIVISGKDKGVKGKVVSVDKDNQMLIVEGVNLAYKHVRPSQKNPQGGRLHKETPIRACKVMVVCPFSNKPTRVGYRYLDDGSKERFARVSEKSLGQISPAKATYAKA